MKSVLKLTHMLSWLYIPRKWLEVIIGHDFFKSITVKKNKYCIIISHTQDCTSSAYFYVIMPEVSNSQCEKQESYFITHEPYGEPYDLYNLTCSAWIKSYSPYSSSISYHHKILNEQASSREIYYQWPFRSVWLH